MFLKMVLHYKDSREKGEVMTSREKVKRLLQREPIDGIVIDFGGMSSDGISAIAYAKLVKALGLPERPVKVYDIFQQVAAPDPDVIEAMGGDFVQAFRMRLRFGISCKEWKEDVLSDGTACLVPYELKPEKRPDGSKVICVDGVPFAQMPKNGFYYDQIAHPLEECEDEEDLENYIPYRMTQDEIDYIVDEVEQLYEQTDKAIVFGFGGSIFEQAQRDFNFEAFYCNIVSEKDLMHAYFRKMTDAYMYNLKQLLPRIGDKIQVIQFFDDLGTQTSLQISRELYREMIMPYQKEMYDYVHYSCPEVKILLHSCGAIFDVIPDLIEAGVDMLNPVQISAVGMEPQRLKDTYGDRLFFWGGGADLQHFVEKTDDLNAIREHVEGLIQIFAENGGFVFSQVHNFQYDINIDKVLAIYDVAKKYKK